MVGALKYSVKNAYYGILLLAREKIFLVGLVLGISAVTISWILHFTVFEKIIVLTFSVLVLCLEGFNSALEKLLDLLYPGYNSKVRIIKDTLAGVVLIGVMGAASVGGLILLRLLKVI